MFKPSVHANQSKRIHYAVFAGAVAVWVGIFGIPARAEDLAGTVLDPSGSVVAGASLRLFDRDTGQLRQTTSGQNGRYRFGGLPSGDYLLEGDAASAFLVGSREVTIMEDLAANLALDLQLSVSGTETDVLVTASGSAQSGAEAAKAIDVVTDEEIDLRNLMTVSEAVRRVPGVRVQTLEGPGSFTTIRTRGLRNQDTAVLLDGMRFRDAASPQGDATAFLETMTIVDLERIEFLRGSGSSLYGSNAMAGVLNVTSRTGGGPTRGEVRLEGGGLGLIRGVLGVSGSVSEDRLTYSARAAHLNVTKGVRDGNPYRNTAGQGSVTLALGPDTSLTGRLWYANDYLASTESPAFPQEVLDNFPLTGPVRAIPLPTDQLVRYETMQSWNAGNATFVPGRMDPDGRRIASFLTASVALEHQIDPEAVVRLAWQGVDTNRNLIDGPARGGDFEPLSGTTRFAHDGRTDTIQARLDTWAGSTHQIRLGYEFERESYFNLAADAGSAPAGHTVGIDQRSHAFFAQDQIGLLGGELQIALGARAQVFQLGVPSFSGTQSPYESSEADSPPGAYTADASVAWSLRTGTKWRAHVGNSYRAPSSYERFGGDFSSFSEAFDYWGDPGLAPERSVSIDTGIDQWLAGSRVRVSGTLFYTNLQETIVFDFANFPPMDPYGRFGGYRNSGGGIARGVEAGTELSPTSSTRIRLGYTYTNSDSRTPTIGSDYFGAPGVSDHMFTLGAAQRIARRVNLAFDLFSLSDYTLSLFGAGGRQMIFDGPVRADVMASYSLPSGAERDIELYLKVTNLLNRRDYENGFLGPGAWSVAGIRFSY